MRTSAAQLVATLKDEFRAIDVDRHGFVSEAAAKLVLAKVSQLELTEDETQGVIELAPMTESGEIDWVRFAEEAHEVMMGVAREREIKQMEAAHSSHFDGDGDVQPLADSVSDQVIQKLVAGCSLEQHADNFILSFVGVAENEEKVGGRASCCYFGHSE